MTSDAVEGPPPPAGEGADPSREWQERIERYISPESEPDQAGAERAGAATFPPAETAGLERERSLTDAACQPMGRAKSDERSAERHLPFLSTSRGYVLVELEGSPPPLGQKIQVQEQRVLSSSPSSVHHRFRTIRGSAPTSTDSGVPNRAQSLRAFGSTRSCRGAEPPSQPARTTYSTTPSNRRQPFGAARTSA
jgi:hypothetical protein